MCLLLLYMYILNMSIPICVLKFKCCCIFDFVKYFARYMIIAGNYYLFCDRFYMTNMTW